MNVCRLYMFRFHFSSSFKFYNLSKPTNFFTNGYERLKNNYKDCSDVRRKRNRFRSYWTILWESSSFEGLSIYRGQNRRNRNRSPDIYRCLADQDIYSFGRSIRDFDSIERPDVHSERNYRPDRDFYRQKKYQPKSFSNSLFDNASRSLFSLCLNLYTINLFVYIRRTDIRGLNVISYTVANSPYSNGHLDSHPNTGYSKEI